MPGADLPPDVADVGDWISFADAQTGRLDQANGRTRDTLDIVTRCEARDRQSYDALTRRSWWQRVFG